MRDIKQIQKIFLRHKNGLIQKFKIGDIGIFGSYATGKAKKRSDIDVLVEFKPGGETFDNYMELKFFLEEIFRLKVDLVIKNVLKEEIKEDILSEVVYV